MDIMIDIETLGTGRDVPMFQIGACTFDPWTVEEHVSRLTFKVDINLLDVILKTGFMPNADTVKWWQTQHDPVTEETQRLADALDWLDNFFEEVRPEFVWANSPQFDLAIIEDHYRALGRGTPWSFRQEMDFRTIRGAWKRLSYPEISMKDHKAHDGLSDAESQAYTMKRMLRDMGISR